MDKEKNVLWIKAFHIMAVISWMAALFYLPRLLVYHSRSEKGSKQSETFKTMEAKLLKIIMRPAMIVAWLTGLLLAYLNAFWFDIWFMMKFALVIAMTVFHMYLAHWVRDFSRDNNQKSEKFFRLANEVPTVLMAVIVLLVVLKPF